MATCEACGRPVGANAVLLDGKTYCGNLCARGGYSDDIAGRAAADLIGQQAAEIHRGNCPKCGGPGPVDVHMSHTVYSFIVMTRFGSAPILSCRSCARMKQLGATGLSLVLGWWGFPFGLIMTPVQIIRNVSAVVGLTGPSPDTPSDELRKLVALTMGNQPRPAAAPQRFELH